MNKPLHKYYDTLGEFNHLKTSKSSEKLSCFILRAMHVLVCITFVFTVKLKLLSLQIWILKNHYKYKIKSIEYTPMSPGDSAVKYEKETIKTSMVFSRVLKLL